MLIHLAKGLPNNLEFDQEPHNNNTYNVIVLDIMFFNKNTAMFMLSHLGQGQRSH